MLYWNFGGIWRTKMSKQRILAISGLARAGKNSLADLIGSFLSNHNITSKQFSFAWQVKKDLEPFLAQFGFDVWTEDTEAKKVIRSYMIAHGCTLRAVSGGKHWIDQLEPHLKFDNSDIQIITDLRFPNEAEWVKKLEGSIIHLKIFETCSISGQRLYSYAPNDEEAINDPKVQKAADFRLEWPKYGKIGPAAEDLVFDFMRKNEKLWK